MGPGFVYRAPCEPRDIGDGFYAGARQRRQRNQDGPAGAPELLRIGWFVSGLHGEKVVEHSGGWSGYATHILRMPSRQVTAIVLTNSSNGDVPDIAQQIAEIAMR